MSGCKVFDIVLQEAQTLGWCKPDIEFFKTKAQLRKAQLREKLRHNFGLSLHSTLFDVVDLACRITHIFLAQRLLDTAFHEQFDQVIELTAAVGGDLQLAKSLRYDRVYLDRYDLDPSERHIFATCSVSLAKDEANRGSRVAIKIMKNWEQFERELEHRVCALSEGCESSVIEILRVHVPEGEFCSIKERFPHHVADEPAETNTYVASS